IYYIAMSVLCIVSILSFLTVPVVILSYKVCSTNVAISLVELVINYICYYLLISVPDMIYRFSINGFLISQTACVVLIACSRFTVCESDKLI
ncbi:MAG: hypothetical protein ACLUFX_01910, partial [Oscillospiraceae bacterium]